MPVVLQAVLRVPLALRMMACQVEEGHALRVALLAAALALRTGVDVTDAALAGFLHDVGKTSVPRELLEKPGELRPDEWSVMRQHVHEGVYFIRTFWPDAPEAAVDGVAGHHERLCGTGYPLGVPHVGAVAAVVAVADVYDALTTDRVYRRALGPHEALALVERERLPREPVAALRAHLGLDTYPVRALDA